MANKTHTLRFRAINRDIFQAICDGRKKIETRAATPKYTKISTGDVLRLVCDGNEFNKRIKSVKIFKTINQLVKKYSPEKINPKASTEKELEKLYFSFPGYREKIKKYGIVAWELK